MYSSFSSFGSFEFQFLVGTSYFGKFLCLGICYPFHLYIWGTQIYLSLSEFYTSALHFSSCSYALLIYVHLKTAGTPACVFLSIPLLVAHICYTSFLCRTPFKKVSHSFLYEIILFKGGYVIIHFLIFIHPFFLVSWCVFVPQSVQIYERYRLFCSNICALFS